MTKKDLLFVLETVSFVSGYIKGIKEVKNDYPCQLTDELDLVVNMLLKEFENECQK